MSKKVTPFLWFDGNAKEAAEFYVSIFDDGEILGGDRFENSGPDGNQTVTSVSVRLRNQEFTAFNGGPYFKFNESVSFMIECVDQAEVDYYWNALTADGGEESQCGWLKDKFGLSWQVTPNRLMELLSSPDAAASGRAMAAMLEMQKIDIAALEAAFAGE